MKFDTLFKLVASASLGATVCIAHADGFSVIESGDWTSGLATVTVNSTLMSTLDNTTPVTNIGATDLSLLLAGVPSPSGTAFTGTMTVDAGTGFTGSLTFSVTGKLYTGLSTSIAGSAVLTAATGSFAVYNTGVGNFAYQLVRAGNSLVSVGAVSTQLQAVPEPQLPILLGLGLAAVALRRRAA